MQASPSAEPRVVSPVDPDAAALLPGQRSIDPTALAAVLRRLARAEGPPWLHAEVARRMAGRLPVIRLQPEHVLDWCSFLGGGARLLAQAYPRARFTAIEPNTALLARSRAALRSPWWSARRWRQAKPRVVLEGDFPLDPSTSGGAGKGDGGATAPMPADAMPPVQLLWSNMVLHAAADPPGLIARWHRLLSPGGFAMFSCFGPDTLRELRALYGPIGRVAGIDFVDMHDLGDMMVRAGFADPVMDQETITLQWSTSAALLAELRSLGGNVSPARPAGLRSRRWLGVLERELDGLRLPNGRLEMRFEIAYGHAFKAAPRLAMSSETRVSFDELRQIARAGRPKR